VWRKASGSSSACSRFFTPRARQRSMPSTPRTTRSTENSSVISRRWSSGHGARSQISRNSHKAGSKEEKRVDRAAPRAGLACRCCTAPEGGDVRLRGRASIDGSRPVWGEASGQARLPKPFHLGNASLSQAPWCLPAPWPSFLLSRALPVFLMRMFGRRSAGYRGSTVNCRPRT
jgi:hypothetical protein